MCRMVQLRRRRKVGWEIAQELDVPVSTVSKHLKVLERARLVTRQVRGREHHCRLNADSLADAHDWLSFYSRFWERRLDALDALLGNENNDPDES